MFLAGLPSTTILCISFLGREYTGLLEKFVSHPTSVKAWMLISQRSVKMEPVVELIPLKPILEGT
jgi:separase